MPPERPESGSSRGRPESGTALLPTFPLLPLPGHPGAATAIIPQPRTRKAKSLRRAAIVAILGPALCLLVPACIHEPRRARLALSFAAPSSRTFAPSGLELASVSLEGSGPGGMALAETSSDAAPLDLELVPGRWAFTARGISAAGLVLAQGSLELELLPGESRAGSIILLPAVGEGSLSISWAVLGSVQGPSRVEGALRGPGGQVLPLSAEAGALSIGIPALGSGPWELELRLMAGEIALCGLASALVIAAGMETLVSVQFEPPAARLGLGLILPEFTRPALDLNPLVRRAGTGETVAFRAGTGAGSGAALGPQALSLSWYRDGSALACAGSLLELPLPAAAARLRIDCLDHSPVGGRDARATVIASQAWAVGPLGWVETLARDDQPMSSPSYARGLGDCRDLAWSPGGSLLAAAGRESNAITLFEMEKPGSTFVLSSLTGASQPGFLAPSRLAFATDELIIASSDSQGALYAIARSGSGLSLLASLKGPGLAGAADFALAQGGTEAYVAAGGADAVTRVALGSGATFGPAQMVAVRDTGALSAFSRPSCVAVDPCGALVAVGTSGDDALYLFAREGSDGSLSLAQRIDRTALAAFASLSDPCSLVFSRDGSSLFVLSYYGKALIRLERPAGGGAFAPVAAAKAGIEGVSGFLYPKRLALSADGRLLAVAGAGASDGLALFDVAAPGRLGFLGVTAPLGCDAFLERPTSLAFSPRLPVLAAASDARMAIYRLGPGK